ncbi:MAG: hypothetical protein ACK45H_06045 [Bacteroidota bacterium]
MESKIIKCIERAGFTVSLFCFFLLHSCSGDAIVATVNEEELTRREATAMMEHLGYDAAKKSDRERFINSWIRGAIMRQELRDQDHDKYKLLELKAADYLGDLSAFELEESKILKVLDTIVSEKEIRKYYEANRESFVLQDYLVKALYLKTPKEVSINKDLMKAYLLKNDKDLNKVNSYAKIYAENYYFDDAQWIYFTELTKDIPLDDFNKDNIVLNRTKTYFSDDQFTYYLNILDFKLKDDAPPLDFLRPQIREIILTERISRLREKIASSMYNELRKKYAVSNNFN